MKLLMLHRFKLSEMDLKFGRHLFLGIRQGASEGDIASFCKDAELVCTATALEILHNQMLIMTCS